MVCNVCWAMRHGCRGCALSVIPEADVWKCVVLATLFQKKRLVAFLQQHPEDPLIPLIDQLLEHALALLQLHFLHSAREEVLTQIDKLEQRRHYVEPDEVRDRINGAGVQNLHQNANELLNDNAEHHLNPHDNAAEPIANAAHVCNVCWAMRHGCPGCALSVITEPDVWKYIVLATLFQKKRLVAFLQQHPPPEDPVPLFNQFLEHALPLLQLPFLHSAREEVLSQINNLEQRRHRVEPQEVRDRINGVQNPQQNANELLNAIADHLDPDDNEPIDNAAEPIDNSVEPIDNAVEPNANADNLEPDDNEPIDNTAEKPIDNAVDPIDNAVEPIANADHVDPDDNEPIDNAAEPIGNAAADVGANMEQLFEVEVKGAGDLIFFLDKVVGHIAVGILDYGDDSDD